MSRGLSKIAAGLLLAGLLALVYVGLFLPVSDWREDTLLQTKNAELELQRLSAAKSRLEQQALALETSTDEDLFWAAEQSGEAFAQVQSHISEAAKQAGISLRAATPLPLQKNGKLDNVVIRVEFEADLGQLVKFLRQLEYDAPALPIERATVRRLLRGGDASVLPVLFAQIDISAPFLLGEGS